MVVKSLENIKKEVMIKKLLSFLVSKFARDA
jgi:hypothetical protein